MQHNTKQVSGANGYLDTVLSRNDTKAQNNLYCVAFCMTF